MNQQFKVSVSIFVGMTLILLAGCGGGGGGPVEVNLSGVVQKGAFTEVQVTAYPMNNQGELGKPVGSSFSGSNFDLVLPDGGFYQLEATGTFINEISGKEVTLAEPLRSIVELTNSNEISNINLLTDLQAKQTIARVSTGVDLSNAVDESSLFVQQTFALEGTDFSSLDIGEVTTGSTLNDPNLQLILISGAALQAVDGNNIDPIVFSSEISNFGSFATSPLAVEALGNLAGTSAINIYQTVQPNIPGLPENIAAFGDGNIVFNCNAINCSWQQTNGRTLSLMGSSVLESEGHVQLAIELSSESPDDIEVMLTSYETVATTLNPTATDAIDMVPVSKIITIPAGTTRFPVEAHILLDTLLDDKEKYRYELSPIGTAYGLLIAERTISIRDGFGEATTGFDNQVIISSMCLSALGGGFSIQSNGCLDVGNDILGVPQLDTAALGIDLSLQVTCDTTDTVNCKPSSRNWLVQLSLEATSIDNGLEAEQTIGNYFVSGEKMLTKGDKTDVETAYVHLDSTARQIISQSRAKNWTWRIRAKLAEVDQTNNAGIAQIIRNVVELPVQISAADQLVDYRLTSITQTDNCNGDNYLINGSFSLDGVTFNDAVICVAIEQNGAGSSVTATLQPLYGIKLTGNKIQLPAFHSAHLVYGDQRVQVLGADYFYVPQDVTNEQLEENKLCEALGCYQGQDQDIDAPKLPLSIYLHSDGWPFAFRVSRGVLYSDGIKFDFNDAKYIHAGEYSANDVRSTGQIISNDIIYSSVNDNPLGQLTMRTTGFDVSNIRDNVAAQGDTAFPRANLSWPSFNLSLTNSRIDSMTLPMDVELNQSTKCEGCLQQAAIVHRLSGNVLLQGSSASLGHLTVSTGNASVPTWGNVSGNEAFKRESDLLEGETAVLALPGFTFEMDEPTSDIFGLDVLLRGHVEERNSALVLNSILEDSAIDGNFWPTGIAVGPELYYDQNATPSIGNGRLLNGLNLTFNNGINSYSKPVNIGAKYVIRNAGITGVFNLDIDPNAGEKMPFYGYDMTFSRFAFRQTNNTLEDYTWIDGFIYLPGKNDPLPGPGNASFDVDFVSLSMGCDAKFGPGNIQNCSDPSCQKRLEAWEANTDLINMAFVNQFGGNNQCIAEIQQLSLEQSIGMNALDKSLGLTGVIWTPDGNVKESHFATFQNVILDAKPDQSLAGFNFSPNQGGLKLLTSPANYGVVDLTNSLIATDTIWDAIPADIRLRNTASAAEQSVVVAKGKLADISDNTNDTIALNLTNPDLLGESYSPTAKYLWASKLPFELPVYYATGDESSQSSFFGRYRESDLIVMNTGAGVNYITPKETYISFGASANIEQVVNLPLQIDLTNLNSIKGMDSVLNGIGINLNLEQVFTVTNPLQPLMSDILASADNGIDRVIEKGLNEVLELSANTTIGGVQVNLWNEITEPMVLLQSIPQQIDAVFSEDIGLSFEQQIYQPVFQVDSNLTSLGDILKNQTQPIAELSFSGQPLNEYLVERLSDVRQALDSVNRPIDDLQQKIDAVQEQVLSLSERLNSEVARINVALDAVDQADGILNQAVDLASCDGLDITTITLGEIQQSSSVLKPAITQAKNVNDALNSVVSIVDVANALSALFIGEADIERRFRTQLNDIAAEAELLQLDWATSAESFADNICTTNPEQYVASAKQVIQEIRDSVTQIVAATEQLDASNQINQLFNKQKVLLNDTSRFISGLDDILVNQIDQLNNIDAELTGQDMFAEINTSLRLLSSNLFELGAQVEFKVNSLVADQSLGEFSGQVSGDFSILSGLVGPLKTKIQDQQQQLREILNFDIDIPGANFSADEFKQMIVNSILDSDAITTQRNKINQELQSYIDELTDFQFGVSDQINIAIKAKLKQAFSGVNDLLAESTSELNLPIKAAGIDGNAIFEGSGLKQLHIDVNWETASTGEGQEGHKFQGWLDAKRYKPTDISTSCGAGPGVESFDVNIGAITDITFDKSEVEATVNLGFSFNTGNDGSAFSPVGIKGSFNLNGKIDQDPFIIKDIGFLAGIGLDEVYVGAGGNGTFEGSDIGLYAFAGRTCNSNLIIENDTQVAGLLKQKFIPGQVFTGLYARGEAPIPIIEGECAAKLTAQLNVGGWLTFEPQAEIGGILGGGIDGVLACAGAVRGRLLMVGSADADGELYYSGTAFAAAGVGFDCDPEEWTDRDASRDDDWCGTADIKLDMEYIKKEWKFDFDSVSLIH